MSVRRLIHLRDYWRFSRRYAKFLQLIRLTEGILNHQHDLSFEARAAIRKQYKLKIRIQEEIGLLLKPYASICAECSGECCQGIAENYFTVLDYWISGVGGSVTISYTCPPRCRWYDVMLRRIGFAVSDDSHFQRKSSPPGGCTYLGPKGCILNFGARPIKCSVSSCMTLRTAMNRSTKARFCRLIKDLYLVCLSTFEILKKEANLSPLYGRFILFLTA